MKTRFKVTFNAPAVLWFSIICFGALALNYVTNGISNEYVFMTYHSPLNSFMTYIRLFTHVFGHANWAHFISNMSYILLLGPMLEEKYGSARVVEIITITAAVTGIINYIFFPDIALCGASGVCFAFILLASFTGFKKGEIPLTVLLVAAIYMGQQIYEGIVINDNISNMAHLAGGSIGAVLGYHLNKR